MKLLSFLTFAAGIILSFASYLFFDYSRPIIKNFALLVGIVAFLILTVLFISAKEFFGRILPLDGKKSVGIFLITAAALLVYAFLQSALLDYFQPFSLYDDVIYLTLAAFLLLILRFVITGIMAFFGKELTFASLIIGGISLLFLFTFWGWNFLQSDFAYQNIVGEPVHIFHGGQDGYDIYRIPSLLVIPEGSTLADGKVAHADIVLALAEGRHNGSLDDGDVDLVMKRSMDGGQTWSDLVIVREWEDGVGKIGNATPVFDAETGMLYLFHIAGGTRPYTTWIMESTDGGLTFDAPYELGEGIVGPGHGIQLSAGNYRGRLLIPAHVDGSSLAWISDDHGASWTLSKPVGVGNESEIAEMSNGELIMAVRTNHSVAKPHGDLYQLFSTSADGGSTWSAAVENETVRTPICMVSIVNSEDDLYFSYPNDFHSRAKLTIAHSNDNGQIFSAKSLIYAGPAGYSEMGVLSNGDILLLFENGAVEYDERITLVEFLKGE